MTAPAAPGALSRGEIQDRAVRGALWTMIHTVVALPLGFVVNLVVANILRADNYGRLALLTTTMQVAGGIASLGLAPAVIQFGTKAHSRGDRGTLRHLLSTAQGFQLLVGAPVLTAVVVVVGDVGVAFLLLALLFGIWLPAALSGAGMCLTIEHKTAQAARVAMISNVVVQGAVLSVVLVVGTPDAVWAGRLVVTGLLVVLALLPISADYRRALLRPRLPSGFPSGFWAFAVPAGVSGLIATLVVSRTEVFLLAAFADETATGVFALSFGIVTMVFAPAQAIVGPVMPAASGLREVDLPAVGRAFVRVMSTTSTVVAALAVLVLPPLAALVPVLYGASYAQASLLVLALGLSGALIVVTGPISMFVLARYSARQTLVANLAGLAVDLGVAVLLIPWTGVWGAVVANVLGAVTRFAMLLRVERRALRLPWGRTLSLFGPLPIAVSSCVLGWVVSGPFREARPGALLGSTAAAAVATLVSSGVFVLGVRLTGSGLTGPAVEVIVRVVPGRAGTWVAVLLRTMTQRDPVWENLSPDR